MRSSRLKFLPIKNQIRISSPLFRYKFRLIGSYDIVELAEVAEPSVGSGEFGIAQLPGDGSSFTLEHRAGHPDSEILLRVVPVPDEPVGFFVARPPRASFARSDARIGFGLILVPLAQIRFPVAQDVEDLRLAATELDGQLAHFLARLSRRNHLNSFGETQFLSLPSGRCSRNSRVGRLLLRQ